MAKNILAWSNVGSQFYRELGKKPNGMSLRFYLGTDEKKATASVTRIEALWDGIKSHWDDLASEDVAESEFPCWDDATTSQ